MTFGPKTWSVGEVVTAAALNEQIRDQFNSMLDAWTPYTPAWTAATTNPVVGNGVMIGRYMKVGRTCHVRVDLLMGSTTTYGSGGWSIGLPFAASATGVQNGIAHALMSMRLGGHIVISPSATAGQLFFPTAPTPAQMSFASATIPITWAAAARLTVTFTYETAA
ncbi:hypothetical protein [Streptomyces sp. NBC_00842]|uniref:hypothetical protein n=1 Tax=Streptomyces sp. NBC_00842 TaxID=2975848 RepID=UPI00386E5102|nr:hypothetical protein OH821_17195 [Streptomyces sp. NBC_00842]